MSRVRVPLPTRVQGLPELAPPFHERLDEGLAALGVSLDPSQLAAIEGHVRLLLAWNEAINLTAIREPEAVARLHVLDSLAAQPLLREAGVDAFLDLGSGGGFPGLPLAIGLAAEAVLLDSIGKKARFLATAVDALGLDRVSVVNARAEALARDPVHAGRWAAVTARAVAALPELVAMAFPLLAPGGRLLAWKRGDLDIEIAAARRVVDALGGGELEWVPVGVPSLPDHGLVVVRKRSLPPARRWRPRAARGRRP